MTGFQKGPESPTYSALFSGRGIPVNCKSIIPSSRCRRVVKWSSGAISVLILATWVVSLLWCFSWNSRRQIFILGGILRIELHALSQAEFDQRTSNWPKNIPMPRTLQIHKVTSAMSSTHKFGFRLPLTHTRYWNNGRFYSWAVQIPLWIPLLLTILPTAWIWYSDRRRVQPGHCPRCRYDLTGNTSGICSECGNAVTRK